MKINGMLSIQWIVLMNLLLMSEANILGNSTWKFQPRVTTQSSKFTTKSLTQTSISVEKKHHADIRNDSKPMLLTRHKQSQNNNALNNFKSRIPQNLEGTDKKAVTSSGMNINTKLDLENFKQTEDMNNGQVYVHHSNKVLKEVEERLSNSGVTSEKNTLRVYQGNKYIEHGENIIRAPNFETEQSTRLVEASKDIGRLAQIVEQPIHVNSTSINKCKKKNVNNLISKFENNSTILTKKEILKTRSGESLNNIILYPDENALRVYQGKKFLDRKKKAYKPKKTYKLAKSTIKGKNIKKMKNNVISLNHKNITLYPKINASQLLKTNKTQRHIITVSTSSRDATNMKIKNLKHNKQWLKRQPTTPKLELKQIPKKLYKDNFILNYPSELSINLKNESDKPTKKQIYSIKILSPNFPLNKINETTSGLSRDMNPIHRLHLQKKDGVHRQLQEFTDKLLETLKPNTEPTLKHLNKKIHKNILNLLKIFEPGENLTEDSKIESNVTSAKKKNDSESSNGKKTIRVYKTKIFSRKKTKISQQTNEAGQKNRKSNGITTPSLILKEDIKVKSSQTKKLGDEPSKKDGFSSEKNKKKTPKSKSKVPKIMKRDPLLRSNEKKAIEKMPYKRPNEVRKGSTFKGNVTEKVKQSRKGDNAILGNRKRKIEVQRNQMVRKRGNKGAKYYTKQPTVTKKLDELVERDQRKIRKNGRDKMGSRNATRIEKKKKQIMAANFGTKNKNQQVLRRERMEEKKKRKKTDFKLKNLKKEIETKNNPIPKSKMDEKQVRKRIKDKNDDFVNDSTSPTNLVKSKKLAKTKFKYRERKNGVKTINADKRKLNNTSRMSIVKNEELKKQTIQRKSDENRFTKKFNETKNNTKQRNEKDANTFHQITNKTNRQLDNEIIKKINHKINPQKIANVKNKTDESNIIEKFNVTNEKQGLRAEGTFERDVHENEIDDVNVWKNMSKRKEALLNDKRQIEVRNMDTIAGRVLTVEDVKPTKGKRNEVPKSRFTRKLADKVDETVGAVSENQTSEPKNNLFVTSGRKTIRDTSKINALEDVITSTRSFNESNFKLNSEEKKSLVEKLFGFPLVKRGKTTVNDKENISISPVIMELKVNRNDFLNNTQLSKPSGSPETKIFNNNLIFMDNKNRTTQIKSLVDEKVRKTRGRKSNRKTNRKENVEEISENESGRKSKLENRSRKKDKMNKKKKESSKDSTKAVTNKQTKRRDGKKEKQTNAKLKQVGKYNKKGKKGRELEDEDLDVKKLEREKQRPGTKKKEKGMKKGVTEKKKRKEISKKKKTSKKLDRGDDASDSDDEETFNDRMAKKDKRNRLKKVKKDKGRNENVEIIKKKEEKKSKKTRRKEMRKDELRSRKPSSRQNTDDYDEIPERKPKPAKNKGKTRRKGVGVEDPEEAPDKKQRGTKSKVKKLDSKRKNIPKPNKTDEKKAKVDKKKPNRKDKKYRRREEKQKRRKENIKEVRHIKEEEQNAITNSGNFTLGETLIDQSRKLHANESIANNTYRKREEGVGNVKLVE